MKTCKNTKWKTITEEINKVYSRIERYGKRQSLIRKECRYRQSRVRRHDMGHVRQSVGSGTLLQIAAVMYFVNAALLLRFRQSSNGRNEVSVVHLRGDTALQFLLR